VRALPLSALPSQRRAGFRDPHWRFASAHPPLCRSPTRPFDSCQISSSMRRRIFNLVPISAQYQTPHPHQFSARDTSTSPSDIFFRSPFPPSPPSSIPSSHVLVPAARGSSVPLHVTGFSHPFFSPLLPPEQTRLSPRRWMNFFPL